MSNSDLKRPDFLNQALAQIKLPLPDSHKGQNGKLLIVGGSNLFHAASKWSLDIASRFVDMVFYSSVPANNQLIHEAKQNFWNGIVIERNNLLDYLKEADCILIGPGMERQDLSPEELQNSVLPLTSLNKDNWEHHTAKIMNSLLAAFPDKKWVIDAGALQMVLPNLLTDSCIITPHQKELSLIEEKMLWQNLDQLNGTILIKGKIDQIINSQKVYQISGGNAGMTKGGTGDVLAGLLAGLYANNEALTSCLVASYINKEAGDYLYKSVGPFFNASDLVQAIPKILWQAIQSAPPLS